MQSRAGVIEPAPLGCLNSKPVSNYRLQDEQCTFSPGIDGHIVGASPANPIIIDDHYIESSGEGRIQDSCEQSIQSNVYHQTAQSAIQGRLEVGVTQANDQLAQTGLDGDQVLDRLPQADSSKDGQLHNKADEIESSRTDIVPVGNQVGNLEGGHSINAAARTPNTGRQPQNPETDASKAKEDKGSDKCTR